MHARRAFVAGIAAIVTAGGVPTGAAELYTSLFEHGATWTAVSSFCSIVNVGSQARNVTIELRNESGTVVKTVTAMVQPGGSQHLYTDNTLCTDGCWFYCRFDVYGSKDSYRASAMLVDGQLTRVSIPAQ